MRPFSAMRTINSGRGGSSKEPSDGALIAGVDHVG